MPADRIAEATPRAPLTLEGLAQQFRQNAEDMRSTRPAEARGWEGAADRLEAFTKTTPMPAQEQ